MKEHNSMTVDDERPQFGTRHIDNLEFPAPSVRPVAVGGFDCLLPVGRPLASAAMEPNSPHQNSVGHSSPSTGSNNTSLVVPVGVHAAARMTRIVQSMNRLLVNPFCQP